MSNSVDQIVVVVVSTVNSALAHTFPNLEISPEVENLLRDQVRQLTLTALRATDDTLRSGIVANGSQAIGGSIGGAVGVALAGALTAPIGGLGAIVGAEIGTMLGAAAGHLIGVTVQDTLEPLVANAEKTS